MKIDPAQIDLLVMDVDGVMTDGRIIFTDGGQELKMFCVQDGAGLKYWHRCGKKSAIVTGRSSPVVLRRAQELGIHAVRQGALNKLPAFEEVLAELQAAPERTAYIGDDLPDIPPMRQCGLAISVANAVDEVKALSHWHCPRHGGQGAVRWAVEELLKAGGLWQNILARYGI